MSELFLDHEASKELVRSLAESSLTNITRINGSSNFEYVLMQRSQKYLASTGTLAQYELYTKNKLKGDGQGKPPMRHRPDSGMSTW